MARWSAALNKFIRGNDVTPVPSAARTASGDSGWLSSEEFNSLILTLAVTVDNFTTLDVAVTTASDAAGTGSRSVGSFTQASGVTTERKQFNGFDNFYKVAWTLVGTGGTWSVSGVSK